MSVAPQHGDRVLTVLELTRAIKEALADQFTGVWVRGEISGFKRAPSGHLYFKLKSGREAVLDSVLWARTAAGLSFEPREGVEVEAFGDVTVWEPRGNYQFSVKQMRPAGLGALLLRLEELKRRLQGEGLFDAARKRPLPRFPRRIGIVTSPVGAAVRDLLKVLRQRWPAIQIVFAPVRVQGPGAAEEIAAAIRRFGRYGNVDVLIVGRGGGSIEDLWAFNEEVVVRALAASPIPTISAVGHEIDTTLADHVADVRAATPSNAAERAVPDAASVADSLRHLHERADRAVRRRLESRRQALLHLTEKYGFERLHQLFDGWRHRVDGWSDRIRYALGQRVAARRRDVDHLAGSWALREWPRRIPERRADVRDLDDCLAAALVRLVHDRRRHVSGCTDQLRALSPRRVLERGYCLARAGDGSVVRSAAPLAAGDRLTLEFARGEADARVEAVRAGGQDGE